MDAPATLVWIAPEPADAEQSRGLSRWASTHGVKLVEARDERPPAIAVDGSVADAVDDLLDRARDAMAARDGDAMDGALASAEATLRAHAELPQAAWLMAEVERAHSTRHRRLSPVDAEAANRAWLRADALDRGRVPGLGEQTASARPLEAMISLDVPPEEQVWLDGERAEGATVPTRAGPHALVVTWDGAPVWAAWIDVPPGSIALKVPAPGVAPCSSADVARARLVENTVRAQQVHCPLWVVATKGPEPGAVRVATCELDQCGPLTNWLVSPAWTVSPPLEHHPRRWPAWATWALVGASAAAVTGVSIVASGALKPAPTQTLFVQGGFNYK
jgi:hypothetical protein